MGSSSPFLFSCIRSPKVVPRFGDLGKPCENFSSVIETSNFIFTNAKEGENMGILIESVLNEIKNLNLYKLDLSKFNK